MSNTTASLYLAAERNLKNEHGTIQYLLTDIAQQAGNPEAQTDWRLFVTDLLVASIKLRTMVENFIGSEVRVYIVASNAITLNRCDDLSDERVTTLLDEIVLEAQQLKTALRQHYEALVPNTANKEAT